MRRVVLESPYAGKGNFLQQIIGRWLNRRYARQCVRHALLMGEAPLASHLLYTQTGILCDEVPAERKQGIEAGHAWTSVADAVVVYVDRGMSSGMTRGVEIAKTYGIPIEYRAIKTPRQSRGAFRRSAR